MALDDGLNTGAQARQTLVDACGLSELLALRLGFGDSLTAGQIHQIQPPEELGACLVGSFVHYGEDGMAACAARVQLRRCNRSLLLTLHQSQIGII